MNARKKTIDKTFLSMELAENRGFLHRDYIAHCLRWSHVIKRISSGSRYKTARILDVGCGRELPLARTLYSNRMIPESYVGVDVGPVNDDIHDALVRSGKFRPEVYELCDFLDFDNPVSPTHIVSFEVMEHVEPDHMLRMLAKMRRLAGQHGEIIISTPVWNVRDCADNHVNEMRYGVFCSCLKIAGLAIMESYGTFASQSDYKHLIGEKIDNHLWERLSEYYDSNVLSCLFAPLFPALSRNALWVCRDAGVAIGGHKTTNLWDQPEPWGSSERWKELKASNWLEKFIANPTETT